MRMGYNQSKDVETQSKDEDPKDHTSQPQDDEQSTPAAAEERSESLGSMVVHCGDLAISAASTPADEEASDQAEQPSLSTALANTGEASMLDAYVNDTTRDFRFPPGRNRDGHRDGHQL